MRYGHTAPVSSQKAGVSQQGLRRGLETIGGELHFELVDSVFQEEDFLGFGIDIPAGQTFEVSLAHAPRETRREQGGSDEEGDGSVEDIEVLRHANSSKAPQNDGSQANSGASIASNRRRRPARRLGDVSPCNARG